MKHADSDEKPGFHSTTISTNSTRPSAQFDLVHCDEVFCLERTYKRRIFVASRLIVFRGIAETKPAGIDSE